MSVSRVSIFNRSGEFMTTIQTATERSWMLSDYGECNFTLALRDAKAIYQYMRIGNLVYIEHDKLPAWGGKILPDEIWNDDETVTWTAYSGEALLALRRTAWGQLWQGNTAGNLFRKYIAQANLGDSLNIRMGSVWYGGTGVQDAQDAKSVYDHLKELTDRRGNDYSIEPVYDVITNQLWWYANYWEKRGAEKDFTLKEGFNIEKRSNPLRSQRWPVNNILGFGDGADTARPIAVAWNLDSIAEYGLMSGSEDFPGCVDFGTVQAHTQAKVNELKDPRRTFKITALDVGNTFVNLRLGDTLKLKMQTVGWDGIGGIGTETRVRIKAMRYDDLKNRCDLTVDEVL